MNPFYLRTTTLFLTAGPIRFVGTDFSTNFHLFTASGKHRMDLCLALGLSNVGCRATYIGLGIVAVPSGLLAAALTSVRRAEEMEANQRAANRIGESSS